MKFNIIGIGEVLWDMLPEGRRLGGAPANFAYHASALGAQSYVVSRVGEDALGDEIFSRLRKLRLSTDYIERDPEAPTGTVTVQLDAKGHPNYTIHENVAWDRLEGQQAQSIVAKADGVCFGTLAQRNERSRQAIRSLIAAVPPKALRILDVNLRQKYFSREVLDVSLQLANVLKLNDGELPVLAEQFALAGDVAAQLQQLAKRYDLKVIALTRGEHGSILYSDGTVLEQHGVPTTVVDTIGAGDSFTAALALGLLSAWPLEKIQSVASEVAAYVCSCSGATPQLPPRFRLLFESNA